VTGQGGRIVTHKNEPHDVPEGNEGDGQQHAPLCSYEHGADTHCVARVEHASGHALITYAGTATAEDLRVMAAKLSAAADQLEQRPAI
jgi:hypothetical protein